MSGYKEIFRRARARLRRVTRRKPILSARPALDRP
jgi:hypothetical protein